MLKEYFEFVDKLPPEYDLAVIGVGTLVLIILYIINKKLEKRKRR